MEYGILALLLLGIFALLSERKPPEPAAQTLAPQPAPGTARLQAGEFAIREAGGVPDIRQFVEAVPQHGVYDYSFTLGTGEYFAFKAVPNGRAYDVQIKSQPSYGARPADGHSTHRLGTGNALRICFKEGHVPRSLPEAVATSLWWSKLTATYIRDGKSWS
ncbi:hypothetical protein [Bosea sp. (in: a-proteobacteria)]|uniref:hypothetical protein n=1 Tax=Bosea sp. (in: a-proteobacteria) TaxID=1871050 RepID=UPI002B4862B7|nr:hypothetical protein [Bosea sp. (in: a-proteobacteria)]WRH58476.1 MAG: hypothetical protein RSE11_01410 [Bosea sp. (in: a-proteobacteria)]